MTKKWVYKVTLSPSDSDRFIEAMIELDLLGSDQLKVIQEGSQE